MTRVQVTVHILLLTVCAITVSGVQKLTVTPDSGSTLSISSSQGTSCKVCATERGRPRQCHASLSLRDGVSSTVEFQCSKPEDVFTVEVVQNIECTAESCSGHIIQADGGSLPFLDFNRKFTWNLKASPPKAIKIEFSSTGLRQINASERCPDRHSYTLQAHQTTGTVTVGKYCQVGTISSAQILNRGTFSLEVPAGQKLQSGRFNVCVGEEIKSLAKVILTLPKSPSSTELLSPNYPESFPDDDVMEWYFQVPDKHKTMVDLSRQSQPRCLKKETAVEYHNRGRVASVLRLSDPQPEQTEGSFSLTLRNCEMDRRAGSPGLSLSLTVSSSRSTSPVSCRVDPSKLERLALHIEKMRPNTECRMSLNSVPKEKISITSNSQLSFQDCLPEDLRVTATRVIECRQLKDCPKTPAQLSVPLLPTCIPASLSSITWTLRPPLHGTVELTSPGHLKQSLPQQPCNDSLIIRMAEDDGFTVGHFCSQGVIRKIEIHNNVSITVSDIEGRGLTTTPKTVLNVRMKEEISERYIFTVSPKKDTPVLVATPGWPAGMKSYSTVSWIVSVSEKMEAHLMFANVSQPKCNNRHTNIRVQRQGSLEEDYSRREDEDSDPEITVSESFFLNMSNCMPEIGDFSVVTQITLQKSMNVLLTIILSVVAALVVIFIIVLIVVCVVIRKKKKKLNHQVSIYNPNGTSFIPGRTGFPEPREVDEHEYASIEDTLVYTHLLKKGREIGVYGEFDTYRPFTGHTDSQKPLVPKNTGTSDEDVRAPRQGLSEQGPPLPVRPPSHGMVDNTIYQTEVQNKGVDSPKLGPRLDPEGGN
ncbi:uncharacterized protein V6R79_024134 [Siganus canaliculatus]